MASSLTAIDMFSGAGLFSAGFQRAGFRLLQAVELDREAVDSYRANIGPMAAHGSIRDHQPEGKADVIIAGPPCQGFSTLGRRDPTDERNELCLEVPRWAKIAKAKVVVVENVPPFLHSPQWRKLSAAFGELGYAIETWELDALAFGVPQRRRRAFTIASRVGGIGAPLATGTGGTVGDALAGIRGTDALHCWPTPSAQALERIRMIPAKGDKRDLIRLAPHLCPPSWMRMGCQATDVWGRMDPEAPANTLRCTFQNPSKGRYLHPSEHRTLSLREGARLQGIPDEWTLVHRHYPIARQIGNGVPVPLAEAVGRRIADALN